METDYYRIPAHDLGNGSRIPILKLADSGEVFYEMALEMLRGIRENNAAGRRTVYIVPVGPTGQYPVFVRLVNRDRVSLRDCWFVNMDEYLAPGGGFIDPASRLSFRGYMVHQVYGRIDAELLMPEAQRIFPDPADPERILRLIAEQGPPDAVFGGVGLNGHLAFNEAAPDMDAEAFSRLSTRVVRLDATTLASNAIGSLNGALERMPRQAVTVGMREMLSAAKIRLGLFRPWHRAVVRRAAYGSAGADFPVTLLQNHPDALLIVNGEASQACYQED